MRKAEFEKLAHAIEQFSYSQNWKYGKDNTVDKYLSMHNLIDELGDKFVDREQNLLDQATCFCIWSTPDSDHNFDLTIEYSGRDRWSVNYHNAVYSKDEKWFVFESLPSSRTEETLDDTRFTKEEALKIATDFANVFQKAWNQYKANKDHCFEFYMQPRRFKNDKGTWDYQYVGESPKDT